MKLVSGKRIWIEEMPIPNKFSYLSDDIECDVVIIGAGIIGAISSYYLTEAGIKTILVDKSTIGYSSTSASTSILQYEIDNELNGLKAVLGVDKAVRCFKLVENAVYDIKGILDKIGNACDFQLKSSLYYTNKSNQAESIKREYELRKEHGFDVEYIDKEKAGNMFSFNVEAGILSKSGCGYLNPYAFTNQLITHSISKGLKVFENTKIDTINANNDTTLLETSLGKKIKSKKVIVATGYEGVDYIPEKISTFTRTFTIVSNPVKSFEGWHDKCIIRDNEHTYTYLRTTSDNRIIIGGEDISIGSKNSRVSKLENMENFENEKYNILESKLKSYFPLIKDISIAYKFNGIFGTTKDELPYIGEHYKNPNCYFSLCYGSNGILYGIIGAKLITDLYLGNKNDDLELFKFGR